MVKNKIIVLILSLVIFSGCGFKVVKLSELNNFYINEIDTEGDKRVNYEIRNNLVSMTKNSEKKLINLRLNSNKTKTIKEKNIKNEIKKYELILNVDVEFRVMNDLVKKQFNVKTSGDYDVADRYSQTLTNEKKLIDILVEKIVSEIINSLAMRNDL